MVDVIEASGDIGVQYPLQFLMETVMDGFDGVPASSAWSKAVTVRFKYRFPFRLKDHFYQGLFGSVHHGGDSQGPPVGLARFGNPAATDRLRLG